MQTAETDTFTDFVRNAEPRLRNALTKEGKNNLVNDWTTVGSVDGTLIAAITPSS